jgi:hypothetical protein
VDIVLCQGSASPSHPPTVGGANESAGRDNNAVEGAEGARGESTVEESLTSGVGKLQGLQVSSREDGNRRRDARRNGSQFGRVADLTAVGW